MIGDDAVYIMSHKQTRISLGSPLPALGNNPSPMTQFTSCSLFWWLALLPHNFSDHFSPLLVLITRGRNVESCNMNNITVLQRGAWCSSEPPAVSFSFRCLFELTLTVTQRERGIVTSTRTKETKVRIVAQMPGPSSSAARAREREKAGIRDGKLYILHVNWAQIYIVYKSHDIL